MQAWQNEEVLSSLRALHSWAALRKVWPARVGKVLSTCHGVLQLILNDVRQYCGPSCSDAQI